MDETTRNQDLSRIYEATGIAFPIHRISTEPPLIHLESGNTPAPRQTTHNGRGVGKTNFVPFSDHRQLVRFLFQ